MCNKRGLNNVLIMDRKVLYIVLGILMIFVLTLTVIYAALSTTLNINGNAEVSAANWDIYLDNVILNNGSVTKTAPFITASRTATFSTTLSKPGDFYEFTIDVVNNGSIDAMIDSVTKTPELSANQKKYLNYVVEYQNGELITTKQLVAKQSFVRLKVKVEFRNDISVSDLPTTSETLNLSFTINYVQADESGIQVKDNGEKKLLNVISGDLETVGSEVAIGDEHFYIISNIDGNISMLAKYNLYVGNECTSSSLSSSCTPYIEEVTGLQDSTMMGYGTMPIRGTSVFSSTNYWSSSVSNYPAYVYDSDSSLYNYVENYRTYLESQGVEIEEARLIKVEELEALGCSRASYSCSSAPEWVCGTSYWSGSAFSGSSVWFVSSSSYFDVNNYSFNIHYGVRPVITLVF